MFVIPACVQWRGYNIDDNIRVLSFQYHKPLGTASNSSNRKHFNTYSLFIKAHRNLQYRILKNGTNIAVVLFFAVINNSMHSKVACQSANSRRRPISLDGRQSIMYSFFWCFRSLFRSPYIEQTRGEDTLAAGTRKLENGGANSSANYLAVRTLCHWRIECSILDVEINSLRNLRLYRDNFCKGNNLLQYLFNVIELKKEIQEIK